MQDTRKSEKSKSNKALDAPSPRPGRGARPDRRSLPRLDAPLPAASSMPGQPRLGECRHVRKELGALGGGNGEKAQLARAQRRRAAPEVGEAELRLPGEQ